MYERFTDRARKVMMLAHQEAKRRNAPALDSQHLLLGLVVEGTGVAACVLRRMKIDLESLSATVAQSYESYPPQAVAIDIPVGGSRSSWQVIADAMRRFFPKVHKLPQNVHKLPQTADARGAVERAMEEARSLGHNYVGTEHLLLGLLDRPESAASQLLIEQGLMLPDVRRELLELLGGA
jgi:ATP-dependent Clp protease ATP-binding subunit ClpC